LQDFVAMLRDRVAAEPVKHLDETVQEPQILIKSLRPA
jgi:hypothetical protein